MRLGLFQVLYVRVLVVIGAAIFGLVALSSFYQARVMSSSWRAEIQQETAWTARHFMIATQPGPGNSSANAGLGRAWRQMHETLRLYVRDDQGRVLVDSHPGEGPP